MAAHYPSQAYYLYGVQPQWPDDIKPALTEDESSVLDDKVLDSSTPANMAAADPSDGRRPSISKMEDDYSSAAHVWHERPHGVMPPARHYSQPALPLSGMTDQYYGQTHPANCGPGFVQTPNWSVSAHSDANTPTPFFGAVQEPFSQQLQYNAGSATFPGCHPHDPSSAVSMSPQSSQGGWASTTSSDAADTGRGLRHSRFKAASPCLVMRSDGVRKKNAKFEIPKERNLANIDALITQSTNDDEKKELKQQKRLLRNRQAALDSRQRKKTHTEKLEQEKKHFSTQKSEMEESIAHLESTLTQEREQWNHQRQQYEQYLQQMQYQRDEAIRTKTLDTADLRRANNVLKDTIRDLERQQHARAYSAHGSDAFSTDFTNLSALDIEDSWEDEFNLIGSEDLKMEECDSLQRQATPRPPTSSTQTSATISTVQSPEAKVDGGFSWNTFYMCLLSGAFIVSQAGSKAASAPSSAAVITPNMPALSDDYCAEAGNVLSAVLASGPEAAHEILPSRPAPSLDHNSFHTSLHPASGNPLDALHTTLTAPSRHQQAASAFSLSAASYNHIANADGAFDSDEDEVTEVKPTRLQQLFAHMQAEHDGIERMSGVSSKARERSVLLDRVPEKVLRDFREMIARVE